MISSTTRHSLSYFTSIRGSDGAFSVFITAFKHNSSDWMAESTAHAPKLNKIDVCNTYTDSLGGSARVSSSYSPEPTPKYTKESKG